MKKSLIKSKAITELEKRVKKYGYRAVEEFIHDLQHKGSPIIEHIENDDKNSLVTFIYEGNKEHKNVLFIPDIGLDRFKDNYRDFQMEKIMETDLWFITYEVRNNLRFIYYFSPDDPLDDNWNERFGSRVKYDKFSKRALSFDKENPEDKGSYVLMPKSPEYIWSTKIEDVPKGKIEEHRFESENLEDKRRIRVYIPYGYDEKEKPYGFMVLTDGDDYISTLSAIETLNNLIAAKEIPPIVAIFIDSTKNRGKELKCNDSFCKCIAREIIPWSKKIIIFLACQKKL